MPLSLAASKEDLMQQPNPALRELIKRTLEAAGMSQADLAAKSGLSAPGISNLLNRPRAAFPDPETIRKLAKGLGIHERFIIAACLQDLNLHATVDPLEEDPNVMTTMGAMQRMSPEERARFARLARAYLPD